MSIISESIKALERWSAQQSNVRLLLGPPLANQDIDALPRKLASATAHPLTVPFKAEEFSIPESYREFLSHHSSVKLEYKDDDEEWTPYEPFHLFSPDEMMRRQPWFTGMALDNREIYATFLVAFAAAGYQTETSRWCFYLDKDLGPNKEGELPILLESNDFECDLVKYVDKREWVPNAFKTPAANSFEEWFSKLVRIVTSKPFDPERTDEIPEEMQRT